MIGKERDQNSSRGAISGPAPAFRMTGEVRVYSTSGIVSRRDRLYSSLPFPFLDEVLPFLLGSAGELLGPFG